MAQAAPASAGDCALLVQQAVSEHRQGRVELAQRLYVAALGTCPHHPEASHNLAILLLQQGRIAEALERFRTALENDPDRELYWLSLARALLLSGRGQEAVAVLEDGMSHILSPDLASPLIAQATAAPSQDLAAEPGEAAALALTQARALAGRGEINAAERRLRNAIARGRDTDLLLLELGDLLAHEGRTAQAIDAFQQALIINPKLAEAHHHLGSILSENGEVARGFDHLMQRARLIHADGQVRDADEAVHKMKHDGEQAAYLAARGITAAEPGSLPFHVAESGRLAGGAVNPESAGKGLGGRWLSAKPEFLVVDDFLLPEALEKLRNYCAESTVWKRVYDAGYIGATPADGFASPFLAQIVEEIEQLYAPILSAHPFRYLGAFKYDSKLSTGTNTHADFSAVNVNLYIAPDAANRSPQCGGMVIWDLAAASEEELRFYNGNEAALQRHLDASGATMHRIPHRANRAVIFASGLFHRTDECNFEEGYLNKRINVSFLFGDWRRPD
jgi:tetratricopeptide (TPR) repeat protein